MLLNPKQALLDFMRESGIGMEGIQLPDVLLEPENIRVMMISESPPPNPDDAFYSGAPSAADRESALGLFDRAGFPVSGIGELIQKGIYLTTAVKSPKSGYSVEPETLSAHLPVLEKELSLFPNLSVVMLMGDTAKKAFNLIAKKNTGKACIPAGSTYKLRGDAFFYGPMRVFPSYIITGGNILIEKSKCEMITDDIRRMKNYLAETEE